MSRGQNKFIPITDWPGYFVDRLGRVRSEFGFLRIDHKGRVRLRNRNTGRWATLYVGEVMAMAGLLVPPKEEI